MDGIRIKKVSVEDIESLQKIGKQTFFETFSGSNTHEDMIKYLEESFNIDKLTDEIENTFSAFFFALIDNDVVGYLKLNTGDSQTEMRDRKSLEIERIYVLNNYQGKRVGQLLYEKAIQVAKELDVEYVWLGVWENNPKAIRFYKKNGFVEFDKHIFKLGNDEQTDIMMKLSLNK